MKVLQKQATLFLIVLLTSLRLTSFAQQKIFEGQLQDAHSDEAVVFASVLFKGTTTGKLSDSSGKFSFSLSHWPSDTLEITCVGYQPYYYFIDQQKDTISAFIKMERGTFNEGVSVKTKVNKGLFLWKKIVQHKPENNRYKFENFSYEIYNKLELDIKNIDFNKIGKFKPFRPIAGIINSNIDSTEGLKYLPAFLTETVSDYYYQRNPKKRREIIKAVKTGTASNESVTKLLGGMAQVVNVYNNFIPVFDKEFVSPISDNGDYYYNYRVVDTQAIGNSRYFHLVFTPRRTGGDTFEGDCWVQAGSFAIQKMNLRLGKDANVNFLENLSMIQEYKLINDSVWFLSKDKFVADLSPAGKNRPGFIGRKTATYQNIIVNDSSVVKELAKNKILEEVITLPDAAKKQNEYWTQARHEPLTKTEAGIIKMLDTLTQAPVFKKIYQYSQFYWHRLFECRQLPYRSLDELGKF